MGAKGYATGKAGALLALAAVVAGCSSLDLQRFAPPGLVKYEEIAGDTPPNPAIQARIAERRASIEATYPNLSQAPSARPPGKPARERESELAALRESREALGSAIETDRAAAAADRTGGVVLPGDARRAQRSLEEAREALAESMESARRDAARERAEPLPAAPLDDQR